jgi:hypothetical protein
LTFGYDLEVKDPSGQIFKGEFNSRASLRWEYDESEVEPGKEVVMAFYSVARGQWVALEDVVHDPVYNSLEGKTWHFSRFGAASTPSEGENKIYLPLVLRNSS